MKIWDIVEDDFNEKPTIDEGWKENILATVIGVAGLFNNAKAQSVQPSVKSTQEVKNDSLILDIGKIFKSGRYHFSENDNNILSGELKKFGLSVLKNPTSDFIIEIIASESRVTNYDMEPTSKNYKQKLNTGELAKKRAETVKFIIDKFASELKKDGVLKGDVKFIEPPKILIGDVPWPSVDKNTGKKLSFDDQSYIKDQYVIAKIKILPPKVEDKFSLYATIGEGIYYNNKLFGMLFVQSRKSTDISKSGLKNTAYQTVLFKTVKPNTALNGQRNEEGVYLNSYIIPWQWWNENVFHKALTKENIDYIIKNFQVK